MRKSKKWMKPLTAGLVAVAIAMASFVPAMGEEGFFSDAATEEEAWESDLAGEYVAPALEADFQGKEDDWDQEDSFFDGFGEDQAVASQEAFVASYEEPDALGQAITAEEDGFLAEALDAAEDDQLAPFALLKPREVLPEPATSEEVPDVTSAVALPAVYDPRKEGLVSPPKNQRPFGMCWAFSTICSLENWLLRQGEGSFDFSEEHLAYFFAHRENDPLGNTAGDKNHLTGTNEYAYREGGNQIMASLHLSTWSGFALESLVPYPTDERHVETLQSSAQPEMAYQTTGYLQDAIFNSRNTVSRYKELIYRYGSLGVSLMMDTGYYNSGTYGYSYPFGGMVNHAVTLVGWDDTYSKNNFRSNSGVSEDGAFIAKNSWGTGWGDGGYFYISFESKSLYNGVTVTGTTKPEYPNNYCYDGSSSWVTHAPLLKGTAYAALANIFEVKAGAGMCEALGEVVVADYSDGSHYGIQVYTNLTNLTDPTSGTPAFETPVSYTKTYAGIGTVRLPKEVVLLPGTYYSVVVTNTGTSAIDYLRDLSGESRDKWVEWVSVNQIQQSFRYDANLGKWKDLALESSASGSGPCVARIKAHTKTLQYQPYLSLFGTSVLAGDTATLTPMLSGGASAAYEWSSSDEKVATVDAQGVVTGISGGTALVTCKVKGATSLSASATVKVTLLPKPASISATGGSYRTVRVKWSPVTGAAGYVIQKRLTTQEEWKTLTVVDAGTTYIDDHDVEVGTTFRYRVAACRTMSNLSSGKFTATAKTKPKSIAAPSKVTVKGKTSYNLVSWKKSAGATHYVIYRSVDGGEFKKLSIEPASELLRYEDRKVGAGHRYQYKVRAYREPYVKGRYSGCTFSATVSR